MQRLGPSAAFLQSQSMTLRSLFAPAFLFFLLCASRFQWSPIDSELASISGTPMGMGELSGKIPVVLTAALLLPFAGAVGNPLVRLGAMPCILFAVAGLSVLWTYDVGVTLFNLVSLASVIGYALAAHTLMRPSAMFRLIWLVATVLIVASIVLALAGDSHALMGGYHQGLWRGVFGHKNGFGPFLVTHMLLTWFGRAYIRLPATIALPMLAVDLYALVQTGSGTALIAVIASFAIGLMFVQIPHRGLRNIWRLSALLIALLSVAALYFNYDDVVNVLGRDPTLSKRTMLWEQAYDMTFQHVLGTGYGTGGGTQVSIQLQKAMHRDDAIGVQSGYLTLALELGWGMVVLFAAWLLWSVVRTLAMQRAFPAQALFVVMAVQHLIESWSESFGGIFPSWSLAVLIAALVELRTANGLAIERLPVRSRAATEPDGPNDTAAADETSGSAA